MGHREYRKDCAPQHYQAEIICQPRYTPNLPTSTFLQYFRGNPCYSNVWAGYRYDCGPQHAHMHGACGCLQGKITIVQGVIARIASEPPVHMIHDPVQKRSCLLQFWFSCLSELADDTHTMDWEGGTIGAIVPALMGHGEAGRASPWPFSFGRQRFSANACGVQVSGSSTEKPPGNHTTGGCQIFAGLQAGL